VLEVDWQFSTSRASTDKRWSVLMCPRFTAQPGGSRDSPQLCAAQVADRIVSVKDGSILSDERVTCVMSGVAE
jgi:hypothetical protein